MAYGNWGAWVYKNGIHMPDWEDQTPYQEAEWLPGYHQAFGRTEGYDPHHAVLGEQRMRLCGYKCWAVLYFEGEQVPLEPYIVDYARDYEGKDRSAPIRWEGEIEGYTFIVLLDEDSESLVDLYLKEPDGAVWTARCGYLYGAGHDDSPSNDAWDGKLPSLTDSQLGW